MTFLVGRYLFRKIPKGVMNYKDSIVFNVIGCDAVTFCVLFPSKL
jgi:hypothetical protein